MPWLQRPASKRLPCPRRPALHKRAPWVAPFGTQVPAPSYLSFNWAGTPALVYSGAASGAIINLPGGPVAAGSSMVVTGQLLDVNRHGIPGSQLQSLTLTLVDTLTQQIVNGVLQVNIIQTGRGSVDQQGNLTLTLGPGDTSTDEAPGSSLVQRSAIVDWRYAQGNTISWGRQQANFILAALAGP